MADETTTIGIDADLSALIAEMQRAEGMTAKQAASMVASLKKQIAAAEKAAKASAAATKKATDAAAKEAAKAAERVAAEAERAAAKMATATRERLGDLKQGAGAVFGGIVNDVEDVGKGLMALGPQGAAAAAGLLAIGGAAVGIYKVTEAMYDLAIGLEETDKKLTDYYSMSVPGFTRASDEARDASGSLSAQTELLSDVMSQAGVIIADRVAPAYDKVARFVSASALAALDAFEAYGKLRDQFVGLLDDVTRGSQMRSDLEALAGSTGEYGDRVDALIQRKQILAKVEEVNEGLQKKAADAEREHEKATREQEKAQREATRAAEERARAEEKLNGILNSLYEDRGDAIDKINRKYDDLEIAAFETGASEAQLQEIEASRHEALMKYISEEASAEDERAAKRATLAEQEKALQKDISDFKSDLMAADVKAMDEADAREARSLADRKRAIEQTYDFMGSTIGGFLDDIIAAGEEGTEAQKKAALVAFNVQKALTIAQLTVDAVRATSNTLAAIPGPAGAIAAVAIAGTYAALAAKAAAAKPPEFHTGGEVSATLLDGEHVMNRRASRNNREALEEMNRTGELPQQGGQMAYVVIGGRIPDDITSRGLRGPRSQKRIEDMSRTGRTRVYR